MTNPNLSRYIERPTHLHVVPRRPLHFSVDRQPIVEARLLEAISLVVVLGLVCAAAFVPRIIADGLRPLHQVVAAEGELGGLAR